MDVRFRSFPPSEQLTQRRLRDGDGELHHRPHHRPHLVPAPFEFKLAEHARRLARGGTSPCETKHSRMGNSRSRPIS